MKKFVKAIMLTSLSLVALSSCDMNSSSKFITYLNYKYQLKRAGDIHDHPITENEVLDRIPDYTSYINLFDCEKSYIDYKLYGNNYDELHCESKFHFETKDGTVIKDWSFYSTYNAEHGQSGTMNIYNITEEEKTDIGTIYVYTPYWNRWQYYIDVDGSGTPILISFEFWKSVYNPLPEWLELS